MSKAEELLARTQELAPGAADVAYGDTQQVVQTADSLEKTAERLKAMAGDLGIEGDGADAAWEGFAGVSKQLLVSADKFTAASTAARIAHDAVVAAKSEYEALPPGDIDDWQKAALIGGGTIVAGPLGTLGGTAAATYLGDQAATERENKATTALTTLNSAMYRAAGDLPDMEGTNGGLKDEAGVYDTDTGSKSKSPVVPYTPGGGGGTGGHAGTVVGGVIAGGTGGTGGTGTGVGGGGTYSPVGGSADGSIEGYVPGSSNGSGTGGVGGGSGGSGWGVGGSGGTGGGMLAGGVAIGGAAAGAAGLGRGGLFGLGSSGTGLGSGGAGGGAFGSVGAGSGGSGGGLIGGIGGAGGVGGSSGSGGAGAAGGRGSGLAGGRGSGLAGGTATSATGAAGGRGTGMVGGGGMGGGGTGGSSSKKKRRGAGYLGPDIDIEDEEGPIDLGAGAHAGSRSQRTTPVLDTEPEIDLDDTW